MVGVALGDRREVIREVMAPALAGATRSPPAAKWRRSSASRAGALVEVREAVSGYRASGLAAEVERAVQSLGSAGVECTRRVDAAALAAARRDPKLEGALAFVVREAVTNVIRHAGAGRCEVNLLLHQGGGGNPKGRPELALTVGDDGRGGGVEGFGITGMRHRVAALGGRMERRDGGEPGEPGGSQLTVRLPMPPEALPVETPQPQRTRPVLAAPARPSAGVSGLGNG